MPMKRNNPRKEPAPRLTHGDLLQLKRWNTPTIYNGWEQITKHDTAADGFNLEEVRDFMPQMGVMVGYAVTVVLPGKTYTYRVAAFNAGGLSAYSSEVTVTTPAVTVPSAPTNLKATVVSPTQINLTWTDTSDNEDGFKLECKAGDAAEWKPVMGRTPANYPSFKDYGLTPGQTYSYRVRAFNTAGESGWSAEVTASTSADGATNPPKSKGQ